MRQFFFLFLFLLPVNLGAQSAIESKVLQSIQSAWRQQGQITFSELYNSSEFSAEEKAFLGRLYEIFFALPAFWKAEWESTSKIPTVAATAASFGISPTSVKLLLQVMRTDPRVPPLFSWNEASEEITSLNLENIAAFLSQKGSGVRLTQWAGKPLPDFELESLDGKMISNKDIQDSHSLIYFWFTGCPPCNRLAPILAELERKYHSKGFRIVGFNADKLLQIGTSREAQQEYLKKRNLNFPNAQLSQPVWKAFGNVNVFPTLFFVKDGKTVFEHFVNFQSAERLEAVIEKMINEG